VCTSKEGPPGVSRRAGRRDVAEGTKVPHDGPAEVLVRLDAGRYKAVARVQMAGMRPVHMPVTQSSSGALRLGGGGNVGRAARMNHGDIQQGGTMGRGNGHVNVSTRPLNAHRGNANGAVTGLRTRIAARTGGDAADSLLPVVVPMQAAAAEAIAAHGMVDVAALDVTTTKASGGEDVRVYGNHFNLVIILRKRVVEQNEYSSSTRLIELKSMHASSRCLPRVTQGLVQETGACNAGLQL
jgi:hypothetical protein